MSTHPKPDLAAMPSMGWEADPSMTVRVLMVAGLVLSLVVTVGGCVLLLMRAGGAL